MNNSVPTLNLRKSSNQNIQVYARVRPMNSRERGLRSLEVVDVISQREIVTRHFLESKVTRKFTFDRTFGPDSRQVDVYTTVVAPLIEEVLAGYNCTVFAYGQTGTGKTHTMVGTECAQLKSSWEDDSAIGIIPRALSHLFDELRLMEVEFSMRISYLELYNEELCDLLSSDDSTKIRIFDDATKKGSVIIQGLEEIPVHSKDDVYKLLEKGQERRKTAQTLMNAQSSRSHTVFSILVHIRENGIDGEEMLKIGKLNLVDLAGSENATKAGNEGMRVRETANINQSLLTLGRVITALVERTPHVPYRESKLTRILQESLGGRTKTSIIATISPGHKDIEETLSTLQYADRAKNIQNKPEVNQKLTKRTMLKEYTEEIDKLKRDLMAARNKNGIYLAEEAYNEMTVKMDAQNRELNEKMLLLKALKEEMQNKERLFGELSLNLVEKTTKLERVEKNLENTKGALFKTKKALNTTKRHYKAKKTLLESHVKTEKVLTDQATQILEVAEVATKDTQQLHSAIERRREVDRMIESRCQQFTERMRGNFAVFDGQLEDLQKKNKVTFVLVNEELAGAIKSQDTLINNFKTKVEELRQSIKEMSSESSTLQGKYNDLIKALSAEHRDQLTALLLEQKCMQLKQKDSIEKSLNDLISNNVEHSKVVKDLQATAFNAFDQIISDLKNYTNQLCEQSNNCVTSVNHFSDVNMKLRAQIDEEYAALEQERQLFENIREKRMNRMAQAQQFLSQLTNDYDSMKGDIEASAKYASAFCGKQESTRNEFTTEFEKGINQTLKISDECTAECVKAKQNNASFEVEISMKIEQSIDKGNTHYKNIDENLQTNKSEAMELQEKHSTLLNQTLSTINTEVSHYSEKTISKVTCASSGNSDIGETFHLYEKDYKKQMDQCLTDLESLTKKEIKTYSSTGSTPSKKDFVYPRVLIATSPHSNIIRRIREENDWSDLDTTATVDEEDSFLENEIEQPLMSSIKEVSYTGPALLNSTPLNAVLDNSKNISNSISPKISVLKERNSEKKKNANFV